MTDTRFSLRRATTADAAAMWAIRTDAIRQICRSHYPAELLERWASSPMPATFAGRIENEYHVVGIAESRLVGFAALKASSAQIEAVFVSPGYGRRGLGRQFLVHLEQAASRLGLASLGLSASLNGVPFYRASGYQAISQGMYTTSAGVEIACVRMEKRLSPLRQ